jgi:hypothetical protein
MAFGNQDLGLSPFLEKCREVCSENRVGWKFGGRGGFTARHIRVTDAICDRYGPGLVAQVWMERPKQGQAVCKFEVAYDLKGFSRAESVAIREKVADSVRRSLFAEAMPSDIEEVLDKSTIVRRRLRLPSIIVIEDDTQETSGRYIHEIQKVGNLLDLIDVRLLNWMP